MAEYHISGSGKPVVCPAKIQCRLKESDGSPAAHGEFTDAKEAQKWAESVLAKQYGGSFSDPADQDAGAAFANTDANNFYQEGINSTEDYQEALDLLNDPRLRPDIKEGLQIALDNYDPPDQDAGAAFANTDANNFYQEGINSPEEYREAHDLLNDPRLRPDIKEGLQIALAEYEKPDADGAFRKIPDGIYDVQAGHRANDFYQEGITSREDYEEATSLLSNPNLAPNLRDDLKAAYATINPQAVEHSIQNNRASIYIDNGIKNEEGFKEAKGLLKNPDSQLGADRKRELQKAYDSVAEDYDPFIADAGRAASIYYSQGIESEEDWKEANVLLDNPNLLARHRGPLTAAIKGAAEDYDPGTGAINQEASIYANEGINSKEELDRAEGVLQDSRLTRAMQYELRTEIRHARNTFRNNDREDATSSLSARASQLFGDGIKSGSEMREAQSLLKDSTLSAAARAELEYAVKRDRPRTVRSRLRRFFT